MPPKSSFRRFNSFRSDKANKASKELKGKQNTDPQGGAVEPALGLAASSRTTVATTSATAGDVPQSAPSHVLAGIQPQSHEQVTTAVGPSASSPQQNTAGLVLAPPSTVHDPIESLAAILPEQLWDRAYDDLKTNESDLVKAYEKLLSRELDDDASSSVPFEFQANEIEGTKPEIRRSQMRKLAQAGLKKTEKEAKAKQKIGNAMQVVLSAKDIVSSAVQAMPQAALAWTGVCFALQILLNPADESKANREGIVYVTSRMDWYWNLSKLLFKENIVNIDGHSFTGLQCELQNRIIDLYKALLSYQMKSVCSYYRNRGLIILGDIIKLDDWNGSLKSVQDAETAVQTDSKVYNTMQIKDNLERLVKIAANQEIRLCHIHLSFQRQIEREESREDKQCLQDLCSTNAKDDMTRIEETKGGLLKDSYVWILSHGDFINWRREDNHQVLWIKGDPGKGKTMLLIGVIRELYSAHNSSILSYFFCQATDVRLNNGLAVLKGLIYQLVNQRNSLISHLRERYDKNKQLFEGNNAFIALREIFIEMLHDLDTKVYLVVDALDECELGLPQLLKLIVQTASASSQVKWLVSSRIRRDIQTGLRHKNIVECSLELNPESVSEAVNAYIDHKVLELAEMEGYGCGLRKQVQNELRQKANGTFLWVALVCQELQKVRKWNALKWLQKVPSDLKSLYDRMMKDIEGSEDRSYCIQILSISILAYRPLNLSELAALAELPEEISSEDENLREIIRTCGSFLSIRDGTIYFIHQSAKDYLGTSQKIWPNGPTEIHRGIVSRSLQCMNETLHRDMYHLRDHGTLIDQVKAANPDPLAPSRYSCVHWINHLCEIASHSSVQNDISNNGHISTFVKRLFLYWLEALSLMRMMSSGVAMVRKLQDSFADKTDDSQLLPLVRDSLRFVLHNRWVIENAPLQVYASALVFSPASSLIREQWKNEEPEWIITKPIVESDWSPCLQTLEDPGDWVNSVVFSHDSRLLASGSSDGTVKVWDAGTGDCMKLLQGHGDWVNSVVFSHDSRRLASGSWDRTVKMWDAWTGECLKSLEGHSKKVWSVTFSHDSQLLASGSWDGTARVWDVGTGECMTTLENHGDSIRSVAFSHNSRQLASASDNGTVKIWDTGTGDCLKSLEGHGHSALSSLVFSHDSCRLAYSLYNTVKVWDTETGEYLHTLVDRHSDFIPSLVFSHDSRLLASGPSDGTVKVWDAGTGECLKRLEGHGDVVTSVVFSHDSQRLASASRDGTVKIWDATTGETKKKPQGHSSSVSSVIFSHNSQWLASGSFDATVKIWDVGSGECLTTLDGHTRSVLVIVFSHDSQRLASASLDGTVKVWDAGTGDCINTLVGSATSVESVVFSHDSHWIAAGSWDGTVRVWDATTGECKRILDSHGHCAASVVFSHDSLRLASASWDRTVRIWNATTGECLQMLEGHKESVETVAFSHDSRRLTSGSRDFSVKIWDVETGECLKTLEGHRGPVTSVIFSRNSQQISSASEDCTVKLWDSATGECIKTARSHSRRVKSALFSHGSAFVNPASATTSATIGTGVSQKSRWNGYSLSSDRSWITWHGHNQLWLPSEYRAASLAVSGTTVAIGCGSGKVIIPQLSPAIIENLTSK